ncbi:MAG: DNA-binding response regulator [Oceanospirillaceae bacterium]|nr:DNA-binding response regulator [Oceanospirillaceae bacterium]MBT14253.1 DNA-binding response regulator [Oceanospirillaceae bacterium]|tara:strand:+ start:4750 stop:5349 length:600 start_codon:yes stop_codon:yes gene_type:complete
MKILICEDHELFRDGLRMLLHEAAPQAHILEAGSFPQVTKQLAAHPDVALVLFDIQMPGTEGLQGLKDVKSRYPALPLVVISTLDHNASIEQMLQLGADGFIAKTCEKPVMLKALQDVLAGEEVVVSGGHSEDAIVLSPRQLDTLMLLAQGMTNKDIASRLGISSATVREYVSYIIKRFDCENRTQAVLKARQLGYILD